jgi:hypothetical protein
MATISDNLSTAVDGLLLDLTETLISKSVAEALMLQHSELRLPRHLGTEHPGSQLLLLAGTK